MNLVGSFYAGAKPLVSVSIRPMILILFDMIFYPMATYIIFIELIFFNKHILSISFSTIKATFSKFQTRYSVPTLSVLTIFAIQGLTYTRLLLLLKNVYRSEQTNVLRFYEDRRSNAYRERRGDWGWGWGGGGIYYMK